MTTEITTPILTDPKLRLADNPFLPSPWLRQGHLQTLLSRIKPNQSFLADQPVLVDAGPDYCDTFAVTSQPRHVQLLGYYSPHLKQDAQSEPRSRTDTAVADTLLSAESESRSERENSECRGLVLLLHGWEGCSHSNYNLALTGILTRAGFDVFRLNLRDHGPGYDLDPYGLNPGIFLGVLIDEAAHATRQIAAWAGDKPLYIAGASMGGNFALRLAAHHSREPIPNLRKVIAINPATNPATATDNVDGFTMYRRYFRNRWFDSLMTKAQRFPTLYDFSDLAEIPTIRAMTEHILRRYRQRFVGFPSIPASQQPFPDADHYFAAYAVRPETLADLAVPTEIITALDDPIIDADELYQLANHPLLSLQVHPTGGHVGYVNLFPIKHHLPQMVLQSLLSTPAI